MVKWDNSLAKGGLVKNMVLLVAVLGAATTSMGGVRLHAQAAANGCGPNAHVAWVETKDDEEINHCKCNSGYERHLGACVRAGADLHLERKQDKVVRASPSAAVNQTKSLISNLENAATTPHCIGSVSCNFFVARVGELQNIPYFRDVMYPGKKPDDVGGIDLERVANKIYSFIEKAVSSPGSGWKRVTMQEAQELADRGNFVIGVARTRTAEGHGHIVVAVPQTMAKKAGAEIHHGPWVRDSQSPTESVRSSSRFGSSVVTPIWAVWQP